MGELQHGEMNGNGSTSHHTSTVNGNGTSSPSVSASQFQYRARSSRLLKIINWWHVVSVYMPAVAYALVAIVVARLLNDVSLQQVKDVLPVLETVKPLAKSVISKITPLFILLVWWLSQQARPVYLVDYSTFKPPQEWRVSYNQIMEMMKRKKCFSQESLDFMERVLNNSGTGPATAWPPGILRMLEAEGIDADQTEEGARAEAEAVICGAVEDVLKKTGVKAKQIDILIINCSLFSPTPSLCAMVAHRFQMRPDVQSYNLSGMGCSAGLISIELAQKLLQQRPRALALVVSTENLTQALYHGNDRGFLLQNTLFRCGGAAVLLSNKTWDGFRAKFKLLHVVRVQGTDSQAYEAVYSTQDEVGQKGVRLSKDIVKVAGRLIERNLAVLGPKILPVSELLKVVAFLIARTVTSSCRRIAKTKSMEKLANSIPEVKAYVPKFTRAIDHWCIHAGGRGVLDGIEKNLQLAPFHVEPSRMALYEYGNTSSSSIWYELEYIEKKMDLKRGQRVLQIAFGSGFKCNSAVWVSLRCGSS